MLRPEEFDTHVRNGTLRLAFVGMSNAGKSYRSRVLRDELSFLWYQVDEEIQKALGFSSMAEISTWLGFPTESAYPEREKQYLELEERFTMHPSIQAIGKNLVFDTTGSVVHLARKTLEVLSDNCLIVHLDVGEDSLKKMMEQFFLNPKPVAWSGYLRREFGESQEEALRRCYPELLRARLKQYRSLAHVNIPFYALRDKSGEETLKMIRAKLN